MLKLLPMILGWVLSGADEMIRSVASMRARALVLQGDLGLYLTDSVRYRGSGGFGIGSSWSTTTRT